MLPFLVFFKKLRKKLQGAFYGTVASTIAVVVYGTLSEYYIENPIASSGIHSLFESLWWVAQTITTVGYGDVPIDGLWGKVNAMLIMLVGIGSLGILTASIAANLVEMNLAAKLGERRIKMKEHIIVCNADDGTNEIISEFNNNDLEVVLVDTEDPKLSKVNYTFVKGRCSVEKDLENAGIKYASKIVILPERGVHDSASADAKTILTSMVIRKMKKDAYIVSELLKEENREHAVLAGANEVVVKGSMSTLLVASAVTSPGVSKLFYELLRGEDGYRIEEYMVKQEYKSKKASHLYKDMELDGKVVLGFISENTVKIRPSGDSDIVWDSMIVMEPRPKK